MKSRVGRAGSGSDKKVSVSLLADSVNVQPSVVRAETAGEEGIGLGADGADNASSPGAVGSADAAAPSTIAVPVTRTTASPTPTATRPQIRDS